MVFQSTAQGEKLGFVNKDNIDPQHTRFEAVKGADSTTPRNTMSFDTFLRAQAAKSPPAASGTSPGTEASKNTYQDRNRGQEMPIENPSSEPGSQFWRNPGMKTLIDWYTVYENFKRLNAVRPPQGHKPKEVRVEIAAKVNRKENTTWDEGTVKSKVQYMKKRFAEAKTLKEKKTGEGNIGLATVIWGNLAIDDPPPVQAGSKRGQDFDSDTETETEGETSEEV
ncbi:hypothetical protein BGW38_010608 [Lunasporangiospora selenospora]|uniref:Uncharacterized protein n=1 Tax=Lunasporangiospora selenospora TaxID=979761 RepID=A0A9P6FWQ8_9FUNG|nr:hypothetical protein BGW38_010608 [Lunasporangiospora selenospora]